MMFASPTKNKMLFLQLSMLSLLALLFSLSVAWAAESPTPASLASPTNAPANAAAETGTSAQVASRTAIKAGATPVEVDLEGTDSIGAKLSLQVKELVNAGTLFDLTNADKPKIRILISTTPEFSSRPDVGSAYTVIWLFYQKPTSFSSYLAHETGVVGPDGINDLAARLVERTTGIAAKYAYIFEK